MKGKEIMNEFNTKKIVDAWINEKEFASISAFREKLENIHDENKTLIDREINETYTIAENLKRSGKLKAALLLLKYGVTGISSTNLENKNGIKENCLLVVNLKNDPYFKENVFKLAEHFNQDSFVYKGAGEDVARLIGTNNAAYPGYNNELILGEFYENVNPNFASRLNRTEPHSIEIEFNRQASDLSETRKQKKLLSLVKAVNSGLLFMFETFDFNTGSSRFGIRMNGRHVLIEANCIFKDI